MIYMNYNQGLHSRLSHHYHYQDRHNTTTLLKMLFVHMYLENFVIKKTIIIMLKSKAKQIIAQFFVFKKMNEDDVPKTKQEK